MSPAIRIENLGKRYLVDHEARGSRGGYRTLRESLVDLAAWPLRRLRGQRSQTREDFWALKDVNFAVQPGEVVGIIGRNGAGKSTLLKILSQITKPTTGRVTLHGRVASLLEVGTGFHPELSGRENIYLNGAILGMTRREVARKFDEIVAFAEIEQFLDTPVKRYSSGMYMRLAFAVTSHMKTEILLVDEVLAVGDLEFQRKCLGKMGEVSRGGRTVLFVSHNMVAIKSLCGHACLLDAGRVVAAGDVGQVIDQYLMCGAGSMQNGLIPEDAPRVGTGEARVRSVRLTDTTGNEVSELLLGQPFKVSVTVEVQRDIPEAHFEVSLTTLDGVHLTVSATNNWGLKPAYLRPGRYDFEAALNVVLLPRKYAINVGLHQPDGASLDYVERTLTFTVLRMSAENTEPYRWHIVNGYIRQPAQWRLSPHLNEVHVVANTSSCNEAPAP